MQKHDYPNPSKKKEISKDASQIFKQLAMQEDNQENQNANLNELLHPLKTENDKLLQQQFQINKNTFAIMFLHTMVTFIWKCKIKILQRNLMNFSFLKKG